MKDNINAYSNDLKVGDKVVSIKSCGYVDSGETGVIVTKRKGSEDYPCFGVEWKEYKINYHNCNGYAKTHYGYFVYKDTIKRRKE